MRRRDRELRRRRTEAVRWEDEADVEKAILIEKKGAVGAELDWGFRILMCDGRLCETGRKRRNRER
jgi:hypothetical protein